VAKEVKKDAVNVMIIRICQCDPEFCSPVYEHDQTTPSQLTSFALCSPHLHGTRIFASPIESFEAAIAQCFNNLQYSLIAPIEKHGW
jgi:hypothetical protein